MKVLIVPIPNTISNNDCEAAMKCFFNEIGIATKMIVIESSDATPNPLTNQSTQFTNLVNRCIEICGCGDNELSFKANFRKMVINDGDVNFDLLEILTSRKTRKEIQYLKDNHLEWLPNYADRLYKSLIVIYGKDV